MSSSAKNQESANESNEPILVDLPIDSYRNSELNFSKELNNVHIEVKNFADSIVTIKTEVKDAIKNADSSVQTSFSKIINYTIMIGIAAFITIIVVLEGYILFDVLHAVSLLSALISAISSLFLIIGFFALSSIYIKIVLNKNGNESGIVMSRLGSIIAFIEDMGIKAEGVTKIAYVLSGAFQRILDTRDKIKEFEEFKSGLKFALSKYDILDTNIEKEIDSFGYFETDSNRETVWIDELSKKLCTQFLIHELKVPANIINLIYLDYRNLSHKNTIWKEILKEDNTMVFSKILESSNLVNMSSIKDKSKKQEFLELILKSFNDGYSLYDLTQSTARYDELIHKIERSLESVLVAIKSEIRLEQLFLEIPKSLSLVKEHYLKILSNQIHMSPDTTNFLFYNDFDKTKLTDIISTSNLKQVMQISEELVKYGLLKTRLSPNTIARVIKSYRDQSVDFSRLKDEISKKEELIEIVNFTLPILNDYGIETIGKDEVINSIIISNEYSEVVASTSYVRAQGYIQLLRRLAFTGELNKDIRELLILENEKVVYLSSLVAILLNLRGNLSGRDVNKELSSNSSLVNVLYLFQKRGTEGIQRDFGVLLADCVKKVISGDLNGIDGPLSYEFGAIFSDTGRITNYNFLIHSKVESTIEIFKKESTKIWENQLLRDIISSILNETWKVDDVRDMVLGNAVTAYMIVKPQKPSEFRESSRLMSYIKESNIEEIRKIARDTVEPRDVVGTPDSLIMFKDAGTAVRIGLVPPGLSFEKFVKLFDSVVSEYLHRYNQNLPMHLIRVSASESSFYLTGAQYTDISSFENQGVLSKIKDLITTEKYISTDYQLALYSSLKLEKKYTLKETIILLFEQNKSIIFQHLSKGIFDTLRKYCDEKNISLDGFVNKLLKSIRVSSIADFIVLINRTDNDKERKSLQQRISRAISVNLMVGKEEPYELKTLSSDLAEKLIEFSKALRDFGS